MKEIALVCLGQLRQLSHARGATRTKVSRIRRGARRGDRHSNRLGQVYRRIGKLEQAENECVKSLSLLNDQNRSDTDSLLLKCMSELAMIYLAGEKLAQGESLAQALPKIPNPIRGCACLEFTSRANSRRSPERRQAKRSRLSIEVVEGLERILGESHPDTLGASDSLARILTSRGEFEEANQCYLGILSAEKALGTKHPETLSTLEATAK